MLERLRALEENIAELRKFKKRFSLKEIQNDKTIQWSLRYGLLESIQILIDVSCHLVSKYNLGNPSTYSECVELLKTYGYIDDDRNTRLLGMIGLRNLLIHEYMAIDVNKLYDLLNHVDDFIEFSRKISTIV